MTVATTEAPEELERRPKRSSKSRRRPWKKRVRNFILSPVHLVRKYVFRKSPSRQRPESKLELDPKANLVEAAVRSAKLRQMPCYFLFLGLSQSGKSTTISKLFNGPRPKARDHWAIKVHHNSFVGNDIGMKVVDTPGLFGTNTEDQDELIISALKTFLRRDLPTCIPTVTFITAPLDAADDGKLSQFSQMLKELSTIQKYITNDCCSNIVLLLTHAQNVEQSVKDSLPAVIAKYQEAFSKIFPSANCPVPAIAIENFRRSGRENHAKRYHDIIFDDLQDFAEQRKQYTLKAMMDWLKGAPRRFSVSFEPVSFPISNFQEDFEEEKFQGNLQDSGSDTDCETKEHLNCTPYFVVDEQVPSKKTRKRKSKKEKGEVNSIRENSQGPVTSIPEGSQIVLSNKSVVYVEDCLVGDKLLGINPSRPGVITEIMRHNQDDITLQNTPVGTLYCSVKMSSESDEEFRQDEAGKLIYSYQNGSFVPVDASKANVPEKRSSKNVYFIELDAPDATFILNGFPCFTKISNIAS